jgi:hypothetical protein
MSNIACDHPQLVAESPAFNYIVTLVEQSCANSMDMDANMIDAN